MNLGCQPKNVEVYHKVKTEKIPYNYDYEKMIECLNLGLTQSECPSFVIEPQEKVYRDPVIDPRETWNAYIKRIANFDEPPLVIKF